MYSVPMFIWGILYLPIGVEDRMSVIWEKGVVSDIFSSAYQLICPRKHTSGKGSASKVRLA